MRYDVIVVGAGPAGCAAAYDLVAAGKRVLLIDRRRFPREKPCAGGITIKTVRRLRYSIAPVVRQVCTDLVIGNGLHTSTTFRSAHATCVMTVRSEFDDFCLQRTLERGAELETVPHIHSIVETADGVTVDTTNGAFEAAHLVGADGANSVVRRFMPALGRIAHGFAIEAIVRTATPPSMAFDFGVVDFGYGWLFPKRDHVNVGLYTNSGSTRPGRAALAEYAAAKLGTARLEHVVGHHIGLEGWKHSHATARIALAGDAAGLVDPLLGEGIHNAVASGQAAAAAIVIALASRTELAPIYRHQLRPVLNDLRACYNDAIRFYRNLDFGYRVLTTRIVRSALMSGYARGLTFSQTKRRSLLLPLLPFQPGAALQSH
ncbi:MAG: geranylgeranyl reductase family protein [Gemmatimonadota bacterium]